MWWNFTGLLIQMFAGVSLALPNIIPKETTDEWNGTLRNRMSSKSIIKVSWVFTTTVLIMFFGLINVLNKNASFASKLLAFVIEVVISSSIYFSGMASSFKAKLKTFGTTGMDEIDSEARYDAFVSVNLSMLLASIFFFVMPSFVNYYYVMTGTVDKHAFSILFNIVWSSFFEITAGMAIISLLIGIMIKIVNAFNQQQKKPLWIWVTTFFVIGCGFQIAANFLSK